MSGAAVCTSARIGSDYNAAFRSLGRRITNFSGKLGDEEFTELQMRLNKILRDVRAAGVIELEELLKKFEGEVWKWHKNLLLKAQKHKIQNVEPKPGGLIWWNRPSSVAPEQESHIEEPRSPPRDRFEDYMMLKTIVSIVGDLETPVEMFCPEFGYQHFTELLAVLNKALLLLCDMVTDDDDNDALAAKSSILKLQKELLGKVGKDLHQCIVPSFSTSDSPCSTTPMVDHINNECLETPECSRKISDDGTDDIVYEIDVLMNVLRVKPGKKCQNHVNTCGLINVQGELKQLVSSCDFPAHFRAIEDCRKVSKKTAEKGETSSLGDVVWLESVRKSKKPISILKRIKTEVNLLINKVDQEKFIEHSTNVPIDDTKYANAPARARELVRDFVALCKSSRAADTRCKADALNYIKKVVVELIRCNLSGADPVSIVGLDDQGHLVSLTAAVSSVENDAHAVTVPLALNEENNNQNCVLGDEVAGHVEE